MSDSAVRVVVSSSLSEGYDRRYVVVDAATEEVLDDAPGYGYKTAQNAHRAHAYKSMSPQKKRQRDAVKKGVRRWCEKHADFMTDVERSMLYALKDGEEFTEADVAALLTDHSLQPPFIVKELMRHW
jgi:GTP-binding protein EngB required for normal cell division